MSAFESKADMSGSGLMPCKLAPTAISPVAKRSVSVLSKHQTESVDKNVTPAFTAGGESPVMNGERTT
jgi:hypothetical protein